MNNRIFLYSSLFLVLILLFDASNNIDHRANEITQPGIPETSSSASNDYVEPKPDLVTTKPVNSNNIIEVLTDTLNIKIRLSDGALVSSELLKYPKRFGYPEEKVKLLNNIEGSRYTALANVQSKEAKAPYEYFSDRKKYSLNDDNSLTVSISGTSSDLIEITKHYTFNRNSHLVEVQQVVKNKSLKNSEWRQYNTLSRGEETEGNAMLYTYTGAAYFDDEDKFKKIDFSDIEDESFLKETQKSWISMIQHYFFTAWLPSTTAS